jgi:ribosomal protein S6--L-glutamate ligase
VALAGGAPIVLKLLSSTQGKGVLLAETRKSAERLVDAFRGLDANFLVQEFVEEAGGADIRAFVVGGKVVGAMRRQAEKGEFRSNLHRGGTASEARLTPQERDVAREAAKVLRLEVAGVDLLQTREGPKVLEVNSSPGLKGIEKATGKDLAARIIEHLETVVRPLSRHREPL